MPQSLAHILVHLTFSTKERRPFLQGGAIRAELFGYSATALANMESPALAINGVEDHIHFLFSLSRKLALSAVVEEVKTSTSKWIKSRDAVLRTFYWQAGYGAFSVSESRAPAVKQSIANQEEHHRKWSFQDEFRRLCKRHNVPIDERYAWD
jgi:REP element-mobilizing transposase RayT